MRLLPAQTYLSVDEDAAGALERKRSFIYCLIVHIMKQEKEMHIDNLVFKVGVPQASWEVWVQSGRSVSSAAVPAPPRCWTPARGEKPPGLRAPGASAAARATCSPASCTSSGEGASAAARTTRTSWSSCRRTRPRRRRARPSSPSAGPKVGRTPTSGVTSDLRGSTVVSCVS